MAGEKQLILGLVERYSWQQIEPFMASLASTDYRGDVCLFYRNVSPETLAALERTGTTVVPFRTVNIRLPSRRRTGHEVLYRLQRSPVGKHNLISRVIRGTTGGLARLTPDPISTKARIMQPWLSVYCSKFALCYSHLALHGAEYASVMITDVRDVLFQKNPFDFSLGDELGVFLEDEAVSLGTSPHTVRLIREGFGDSTLKELGNLPVANAGVTVGSTRAVVHYLRCMVDTLDPADRYNQGVHNVLFYSGAFGNVRVFQNGAGPVLTLGYVPESKLQVDDYSRFLNDDGSVVNVLHQYDRLKVRKKGLSPACLL